MQELLQAETMSQKEQQTCVRRQDLLVDAGAVSMIAELLPVCGTTGGIFPTATATITLIQTLTLFITLPLKSYTYP